MTCYFIWSLLMHLAKKRGEKNLPDASDVFQVYLALTQGP